MAPSLKAVLPAAGAIIAGAIVLVVREGVRSLRESRADDPWSPHRKGF
ncbi:MAG: hypothetical protein ACRDJY_08105 [Thermoleophilaceae bacterium]